MLPLRLARATPLRGPLATKQLTIARLPIIQRRTFLPDSITARNQLDEKYPEDAALTAAEDPDMVRVLGGGLEARGPELTLSRRTAATSTLLASSANSVTRTQTGGTSRSEGTLASPFTRITTFSAYSALTNTPGSRLDGVFSSWDSLFRPLSALPLSLSRHCRAFHHTHASLRMAWRRSLAAPVLSG